MPTDDFYRLDRMRATPFPNRLLELLPTLPETDARIVAIVVRSTLGWQGPDRGLRKASAYFAPHDLRRQVGLASGTTLRTALARLVQRGVVEILAVDGAKHPGYISPGTALRLRIARPWVEEPADARGAKQGHFGGDATKEI